jgi:hypothetical protein
VQDADFDHVATFRNRKSRFFIESNTLRRIFPRNHRLAGQDPSPHADRLCEHREQGARFIFARSRGQLPKERTCSGWWNYPFFVVPSERFSIAISV